MRLSLPPPDVMRTLTLGKLRVRLTGGPDGDGSGDGPLCVLLHGFGAPGTDLVPLANELQVESSLRFAFPEAPIELDPTYDARAWWMVDLAAMQLALFSERGEAQALPVPAELPQCRSAVVAMLDELQKLTDPPCDQLVLGGFSQGAILACDVALRDPRPLAGLVLMSGTLLPSFGWAPLMPSRAGLPVLQSHGRTDRLLPFRRAVGWRDELCSAGLDVTFVPFDGGHGIAPSVSDALSSFLTRTTSAKNQRAK